jgi:hypothetical protein
VPFRLAACGLLLLLSARVAAAPDPFELAISGCDASVDATRLRAQLVIELRALPAELTTSPPRITLACEGPRLALVVGPLVSGAVARSEVDLASVPEATRPRVLALAITELMEPRDAAPSPAPPATIEPPAVIMTTGAPPPPAPRVRLYAETSLRRIATPATWLGGLGVGGDVALRSWLALAVELTVEGGSTSTTAASVSWRQGGLTAGIAVTGARGRWAWGLEPAFGVALLGLSAAAAAPTARGDSFTGVWAGPELAARARCGLGRAGFLQLQARGGYLTRTVVGFGDDGGRLVDVSGPWASLGLGGGVAY